jgi:hypothetical protein
VQELLREEKTVAQLAAEHGIHPAQRLGSRGGLEPSNTTLSRVVLRHGDGQQPLRQDAVGATGPGVVTFHVHASAVQFLVLAYGNSA